MPHRPAGDGDPQLTGTLALRAWAHDIGQSIGLGSDEMYRRLRQVQMRFKLKAVAA